MRITRTISKRFGWICATALMVLLGYGCGTTATYPAMSVETAVTIERLLQGPLKDQVNEDSGKNRKEELLEYITDSDIDLPWKNRFQNFLLWWCFREDYQEGHPYYLLIVGKYGQPYNADQEDVKAEAIAAAKAEKKAEMAAAEANKKEGVPVSEQEGGESVTPPFAAVDQPAGSAADPVIDEREIVVGYPNNKNARLDDAINIVEKKNHSLKQVLDLYFGNRNIWQRQVYIKALKKYQKALRERNKAYKNYLLKTGTKYRNLVITDMACELSDEQGIEKLKPLKELIESDNDYADNMLEMCSVMNLQQRQITDHLIKMRPATAQLKYKFDTYKAIYEDIKKKIDDAVKKGEEEVPGLIEKGGKIGEKMRPWVQKVQGTDSRKISGQALKGTTLTLTGDYWQVKTVEKDDGSYSFKHIPNGDYKLTAVKEGVVFEPASIDISIAGSDSEDNNFEEFKCTVAGSIVAGEGVTAEALEGVSLKCQKLPDGNVEDIKSNEDGTFKIDLTQKGSFKITPEKNGFRFEAKDITVEVNSTAKKTVSFTMKPAN